MAVEDIVARAVVELDLIANKFDKSIAASQGKFDKVQNKLTNSSKKFDKVQEKMVKTGKKYKMSTLGSWFAARRLYTAVADLLKPAQEALGLFDLWNTTLTVLFLPVMEALLPLLIDVMVWFMNLPDPVKKAIGVLAILLAIIFAIIVAITAWAAIQAFLDVLLSPFILILLAIAVVVALLIAFWPQLSAAAVAAWNWIVQAATAAWNWIVQAAKNAWKFLTDSWGNLVNFYRGLWEGIKAIWGVVADWFIGIFTKAWTGIKNAWSAVKDFFSNLWNGIKNIAINVVNWMLQQLANYINFWINGLNTVIGLVNKIPGVHIGAVSTIAAPQIPKAGDFIWRAGQGITQISPQDNVIGVKDMNNLPGGSGSIVVNQTNNISAMSKNDILDIVNEANRRLIADIRRNGQ